MLLWKSSSVTVNLSVNVTFASPLFPQRGLNFTHSDQGAKVFHLCADLRHVQAAHVVDVLTQPSRLVERVRVLAVSSTCFNQRQGSTWASWFWTKPNKVKLKVYSWPCYWMFHRKITIMRSAYVVFLKLSTTTNGLHLQMKLLSCQGDNSAIMVYWNLGERVVV